MKHFFLLLVLLLPLSSICQKQWSLEECVVYALENNIRVQQSELNESLSELSITQSKGSMLPNLNGSASHGYNFGRTIDPITNNIITERITRNNVGLNSSLTLFNGFQLRNGLEQSKLDLSTVRAQNEQLKNDISLNVANAYLSALFNKELVTMAENNLEATMNQVSQITKLYEAGQVPEGNLFEVQAQQATDEASLIQSENNLSISLLNLRQLMQLPQDQSENFDVAIPQIEEIGIMEMPSSINSVLSYALNNFPNIKASENGVLSREMGLKIARGSQMPSLRLSYSVGTGYSDANRIPVNPVTASQEIGVVEGTGEAVISNPTTFFTDFSVKPFGDQYSENINQALFLNLSVPIFNGWSTATSIQRAEINLKTAQLEMDNTENQLTQEIESAWADAQVALKNFIASEKSVAASEKAYEYAEIQYDAGVINLLDYNQARIRRDNALAQMINNKYDYIFRVKILDFYQGKSITL